VRKLHPIAFAAGAAVLLWGAVRTAAGLLRTLEVHPGLPLWDMATHGFDGVRLADALRRLDLLGFFGLLWGMGLWPPGYPLLEAPVFLLFGTSFETAQKMVLVIFCLSAGMIFAAGGLLRPGLSGLACGLVSSWLLLVSPFFRLFGLLVMLEIPGVFLLLLAFCLYLTYLRGPTRRRLVLASLATTTLFFCKYNYGILWMVPLVLSELSRSGHTLRTGLSSVEKGMRRIGRRPFAVFVLIYLGFIVFVSTTGGFAFTVAGRGISVRSAANPTYILFIIVLLRLLLIRPRRTLRRMAGWWQSLSDRFRIPLLLIALPILVWLLDPTHLKGFFGFVENRSSHLSLLSFEGLLFYPRAFVAEFSPAPWIGWSVLLIGLAHALLRARSTDPSHRILAYCTLFGLVAVGGHRYKDPRFFFTVAPLIWLSFGSAAVQAIRWLPVRMRYAGEIALAAAVGVALVTGGGLESASVGRGLERFSTPSSVGEPLDAVCGLVAESGETLVIGCWNGLSPSLLEWRYRQRFPAQAASRPPVFPGDIARGASATDLLDRICAGGRVRRVVVLELAEGSSAWVPAYEEECSWARGFLERIAADERFARESGAEFNPSGYRVWSFRRAAGPS